MAHCLKLNNLYNIHPCTMCYLILSTLYIYITDIILFAHEKHENNNKVEDIIYTYTHYMYNTTRIYI